MKRVSPPKAKRPDDARTSADKLRRSFEELRTQLPPQAQPAPVARSLRLVRVRTTGSCDPSARKREVLDGLDPIDARRHE